MSDMTDCGDGCESESTATPGAGGRGNGSYTKGERRSRGGNRAEIRRPWAADEHARFVESLKRFGPKDRTNSEGRVAVGLGPGVAEIIAVVVGTRTVSQVRSHAQKYFLQMSRTTSGESSRGDVCGQAVAGDSAVPGCNIGTIQETEEEAKIESKQQKIKREVKQERVQERTQESKGEVKHKRAQERAQKSKGDPPSKKSKLESSKLEEKGDGRGVAQT